MIRTAALAATSLMLVRTFAPASAAVALSAFSASPQTTAIQIKWTTASELNNAGFNIYRSTSQSKPTAPLNSSLIPVKNPGAIIGASYSYADSGVAQGQTYNYWLESVEFGGSKQQFGPITAAISSPTPTPTTPAPTATFTAVPPTSTRTPTTASATSTLVPANTATSIPVSTRVALVVPSAPAPSRARSNNSNSVPPSPPAPQAPLSVPTESVVSENAGAQSLSTASGNVSEDPAATESSAASASQPNLLRIGITLLAGFTGMMGLAMGAASFYLIAKKFIR